MSLYRLCRTLWCSMSRICTMPCPAPLTRDRAWGVPWYGPPDFAVCRPITMPATSIPRWRIALIVSLARDGDRDAFEELVRRRQSSVRNLMRRFSGDAALAEAVQPPTTAPGGPVVGGATTQVVEANRTNPPDAILREVFTRTGDQPFSHIDDVISEQELKALSESYKQVAGFDKATLRVVDLPVFHFGHPGFVQQRNFSVDRVPCLHAFSWLLVPIVGEFSVAKAHGLVMELVKLRFGAGCLGVYERGRGLCIFSH